MTQHVTVHSGGKEGEPRTNGSNGSTFHKPAGLAIRIPAVIGEVILGNPLDTLFNALPRTIQTHFRVMFGHTRHAEEPVLVEGATKLFCDYVAQTDTIVPWIDTIAQADPVLFPAEKKEIVFKRLAHASEKMMRDSEDLVEQLEDRLNGKLPSAICNLLYINRVADERVKTLEGENADLRLLLGRARLMVRSRQLKSPDNQPQSQ